MKLPRERQKNRMPEQINQNVGEAADHVKVAITKHTESTLKSVDEACDMRIKKAKKELGADYGQKFGYHSHFYFQPPFSWWFSYGQIK